MRTVSSSLSPKYVRAPGRSGGGGGEGGGGGGEGGGDGGEGGSGDGGDGGETYLSMQTKGRREEGSSAAHFPSVRTKPKSAACMMAPGVLPLLSDSGTGSAKGSPQKPS